MCMFCIGDHPLTTGDLERWMPTPAYARKMYYGSGYASKVGFEYAVHHALFCEDCLRKAQHNMLEIRACAHSDGWRYLTHDVKVERLELNRYYCTHRVNGVTAGYGTNREAAIADYQTNVRANQHFNVEDY
jgi:hypothetical protein